MITLLAAGCGGDGDIAACEDCGEPTARGPLANPKLTETSGILMRTRSSRFYYPMRPEQTAAEALGGEPCKLPDADENLGEAVTWFADGAEFFTIGEGAGAQVNTSSCAPA